MYKCVYIFLSVCGVLKCTLYVRVNTSVGAHACVCVRDMSTHTPKYRDRDQQVISWGFWKYFSCTPHGENCGTIARLLFLGCNNGGGGGNFSRVKRLVANG